MVNPHTSALVLDAEMRIQHLTLPARRLLEYNPAQAPAHSFLHHVHDKNLFQVMRDVADMVCHGKAKASWMLRLRTGRGRWRWYKASAHNHLPHSAAIVVDLRDLLPYDELSTIA